MTKPSNPTYVGEIGHKEKRYPGQHEAIVSRDLFDKVQEILATNRRKKRLSSNAADPSLLAGLVFGERGQRLIATHTRKGGRRYRYYASTKGAVAAFRIPAHEVEQLVANSLIDRLTSSEQMAGMLLAHEVSKGLSELLVRANELGVALAGAKGSKRRALLLDLVERVEIRTGCVVVQMKLAGIGLAGTTELSLAARLERRKQELRLVLPGAAPPSADASLIASIGQARVWFDELVRGVVPTIAALAAREGVTACYVRKILDLAFLAPDVIEQIAAGSQPAHVTTSWLRSKRPLPSIWSAQRQLLQSATA